jgi:hypothetical protein
MYPKPQKLPERTQPIVTLRCFCGHVVVAQSAAAADQAFVEHSEYMRQTLVRLSSFGPIDAPHRRAGG